MSREKTDDLLAFLAVARARSFTRGAAQLGISQPALSQIVRQLEERLGVRLLARTTRSVVLTEAGEQLMSGIAPAFEQIDAEVAALASLRDKPAGVLRISASDHAIETVLWPKVSAFIEDYPDIKVEIIRNNGLSDIIEERFDAGVRMGHRLAQDMVSLRIGPDLRFVVVGTPDYFATAGIPEHPRDLLRHDCINIRLPSLGGLWPWEFNDDRELRLKVEGRLVFNNLFDALRAALAGRGLAYVPEDIAMAAIATGQLLPVLEGYSPLLEGYHIYYPAPRQAPPALSALLEALRLEKTVQHRTAAKTRGR